MHGTISTTAKSAIVDGDSSVASKSAYDNSVADRIDWFVNAAPILLAPKPGLILDLLTDCGERNGDRYTSGAVKVPSSVVRRLIHGRQGEPWHAAFMEGCAEPWWLDFQRAAKIGRRVLAAIDREE